ncbi:MAG: hypothetical protein PUC47_11640 [Oscillospiraceae bacterium]|nr:hypothetical protein [Oscillospiraceae bacterium]
MGDQECFKRYAEHANVDLQWQHPADGSSASEQLNLLIASNQLPDVILWAWNGMPGGITKYVTEKIVMPLNDLMPYAPNYQAAMDQYPDVAKVIPLDDGTIPAFYQMDPDPRRTTYVGIVMRTDWLETLGLSQPVTLQDYHDVFVAFRDQDPNGNGEKDELPWTESKDSLLSSFMPAFGIMRGMYINQQTGKVDYGPYNAEAFKEFVTTMNAWYNEGLIDPEFATNDSKMLTAKMVGGTGGATYAYVGGGVGNYTKAARVDDPTYTIKGVAGPQAADGNTYMVPNDSLMKIGGGAAITTQCKNPERVAAMIDYGYSEEGRTLLNYGVEGESYTIVDGKPTFVDSIMNPEEGKSRVQASVVYAQPIYGFAKVMDYDAQAQIQYEIPEQNESIENWLTQDTALMIHPNMTLTSEESSEYSSIFNEIKTYVDEMTLKYILGTESMDTFDQYIKNLENMGVQRMIEIYQGAYDRFQQR